MTDDVTIRAVYRDFERPLTFEEIDDLIRGLQSLVWTAVVRTIESREHPEKVAAGIVRSQIVRSINFNSPLEVVFVISGSTAALAAAGRSILSLWDRYQESRVKTAEANAAVKGFDLIREHMQLTRLGAEGVATVQEAETALLRLRRLERVEDA